MKISAGPTGEFDESKTNLAPAPRATPRLGPPHPPPTPKERTQSRLAWLSVGGVLFLYLAAIIGLELGRLDVATYKEIALSLAGPLGLATAAVGFFFGSEVRRKRH